MGITNIIYIGKDRLRVKRHRDGEKSKKGWTRVEKWLTDRMEAIE